MTTPINHDPLDKFRPELPRVEDVIKFLQAQPPRAVVRVYERLWGRDEDSGITIIDNHTEKQISFLKTDDSY